MLAFLLCEDGEKLMPGNHWAVQIKKKKQGGVRLKFCGHFHASPNRMIALALIVLAFTLAASSLITNNEVGHLWVMRCGLKHLNICEV